MWSNPKVPIFRNETLLRQVATLPCVCCGIWGYTQAAHIGGLAEGKGGALKVSDSRIAALCTVHPDPRGLGFPLALGCHEQFDQGKIDPSRGVEFIALTYIALIEGGKLKVVK